MERGGASPDDEWADESDYRFGHLNPILLPILPPVPPSARAEAALLGPDAEVYAAVRARSEALVARSAETLAQDPEVRALAERLPLPSSTRLLVIGDSVTADWQSWSAILPALLRLVRSDVKVRVVDASLPSATTVEGLCRIAHLPLSVRPHWMFVMLGLNDCLRYAEDPGSRLIPLEGTRHALRGIARWAQERGVEHPPIWLTPAFVVPGETFPEALHRDADDVEEIHALVRELPGPVVDCRALLRELDEPLMPDGRHFTLAAQVAVARAVLATWANASS